MGTLSDELRKLSREFVRNYVGSGGYEHWAPYTQQAPGVAEQIENDRLEKLAWADPTAAMHMEYYGRTPKEALEISRVSREGSRFERHAADLAMRTGLSVDDARFASGTGPGTFAAALDTGSHLLQGKPLDAALDVAGAYFGGAPRAAVAAARGGQGSLADALRGRLSDPATPEPLKRLMRKQLAAEFDKAGIKYDWHYSASPELAEYSQYGTVANAPVVAPAIGMHGGTFAGAKGRKDAVDGKGAIRLIEYTGEQPEIAQLDDIGFGYADSLLNHMVEKGVLTADDHANIFSAMLDPQRNNPAIWDEMRNSVMVRDRPPVQSIDDLARQEIIRKELVDRGIDRIPYENTAEDAGHTSHIYLNPDTMRIYSQGGRGAMIETLRQHPEQIANLTDAQILSIPKSTRDELALLAGQKKFGLSADANLMDLAEAGGFNVQPGATWLHGAKRADRIEEFGGFDPNRATSGPNAFHTSDPNVAFNYSQNKADTSLDMPESYADWFSIGTTKGDKNLNDAWSALPLRKKSEIANKLRRIGYADDGYETIAFDTGNVAGDDLGHWDYTLRANKGNALKAAKELWLESGKMFDNEALFGDVLRMAGVEKFKFNDPNFVDPGIIATVTRAQKPFETTVENMRSVYDDLEAASLRQPSPREEFGVDAWDKNAVEPRVFMSRLQDDINNNSTYAWTAIPDWVTDVLRSKGYDHILDTGGKYSGLQHQVMIPFDAAQLRGVDASFNPYLSDRNNLLFGVADPIHEMVRQILSQQQEQQNGLYE